LLAPGHPVQGWPAWPARALIRPISR